MELIDVTTKDSKGKEFLVRTGNKISGKWTVMPKLTKEDTEFSNENKFLWQHYQRKLITTAKLLD